MAFNSSGSLLASGARDGIAHVWAVPGGRELLRIAHGAPVSQMAFAPRPTSLLPRVTTVMSEFSMSLARLLVADFKCPDKVVSASFSPGGNLLAALSSDGVVSLFDPVHRKLLRTLAGGEAAFNLAFSDGRQAPGYCERRFCFCLGCSYRPATIESHACCFVRNTHSAAMDLRCRHQLRMANSWLMRRAATNWPMFGTSRLAARFLNSNMTPLLPPSAFNADGTKLGTGSYDGTARVWELPSGSELERDSHWRAAPKLSLSAPPAAASPLAAWTARFPSPRPVAPTALPSSICPPMSAALHLARMAGASPSARVSAHWSPLVRIADIGGNILRDIEFHGAPVIDKLFFLDPNEVIAQWSDKLFLIAVDQSSVTPLPDVPGEKRIDPSGKVLAIQQDGVSKLYTLTRPAADRISGRSSFRSAAHRGRRQAVGLRDK